MDFLALSLFIDWQIGKYRLKIMRLDRIELYVIQSDVTFFSDQPN